MSAEGACALLVVLPERGELVDELVGVINLSNIIVASLCSAFVGYYAFTFTPYAGKGLMTEGLRLAVRYAFKQLRLHRIEANIQPEHTASIKLAKPVGFAQEGFSPRCLKIAGCWRDHKRWAIVKD